MQVELLRDIIKMALDERHEYGNDPKDWPSKVYIEDYDDCYPIFKEIFVNEQIEEIGNKEGIVKKKKNGFLINDPYGGKDIFTYDEMGLFIDWWEKIDRICPLPNTNEHVKKILQSVSHIVIRQERDI